MSEFHTRNANAAFDERHRALQPKKVVEVETARRVKKFIPRVGCVGKVEGYLDANKGERWGWERSERSFWKLSILAMKCAKWLQT